MRVNGSGSGSDLCVCGVCQLRILKKNVLEQIIDIPKKNTPTKKYAHCIHGIFFQSSLFS